MRDARRNSWKIPISTASRSCISRTALFRQCLKLDGSGSIFELDSYALKHNFGDTLKRQTEHYYEQIFRSGSGGSQHSGDGIASAHERVSFKHTIGAADLEADDHARSLFVDRLNGGYVAYPPPSVPAEGRGSSMELLSEHVGKNIELAGNGIYVSYRFPSGASGVFSTEINIAMPVATDGVDAISMRAQSFAVSDNCLNFRRWMV